MVYADWLEERGDTQAEYIRNQCRLSKTPRTLDSLKLRSRAADLWRLDRHDWERRLFSNFDEETVLGFQKHDALSDWTYGRGCIEKIEMFSKSLRVHLEPALALGPITALKVVKERKKEQGFQAEHFAGVEALNEISHLDLTDNSKGLQLINSLKKSTIQFRNLKTLRLKSTRKLQGSNWFRSSVSAPDAVHTNLARKIFRTSEIQSVEFQTIGKIETINRADV